MNNSFIVYSRDFVFNLDNELRHILIKREWLPSVIDNLENDIREDIRKLINKRIAEKEGLK